MDLALARFVTALRNADVRVSPAETLDAFAVLRRVGVEDKELVRSALSMALAKSTEDKARFEEAFDRFFEQRPFADAPKRSFLRGVDVADWLARLEVDVSPELLETIASALARDRGALALRIQQAADRSNVSRIRYLREKAHFEGFLADALALDELDAYLHSEAGQDPLLRYLKQYFSGEIKSFVNRQYQLHVDATGRRALVDAALKANLDQIPVDFHQEVRRVVEKLALKLAKNHKRRRKRDHRGVLDLKRTLRRNLAYDGAMFDVRWRRQKRARAKCFVLCDVSSSVARVARFLLLFLYELSDVLPNVRAFAFSSELGEVTDVFSRHPSERAIEAALFSWGKGNTDYGRAFGQFRALCGKKLDQRSTLIVLGDGRSNFYDPKVTIFKELAQRAKQVYWLNPESREQWREGDSVMPRYAPHCFRVAPCNRIQDIEWFADQLLTATR